MKQNNHGFSLIETVVAMAILGAFSVSIATSLVLSLRMNEKTSTLMQEQMAVSSAVEALMAEGIESDFATQKAPIESQHSVSVTAAKTNDSDPYFNVTVTSSDGNVSVTTQIREAVGAE